MSHFHMPFSELSDFQRKQLEKFTRKMTTVAPPPGFTEAPKVPVVAPAAVQQPGFVSAPRAMMPMAPAAVAAPQTPMQPVRQPQPAAMMNNHPSGYPNGYPNGSAAVSMAPPVQAMAGMSISAQPPKRNDDTASDDDEEERQKRSARLAARKAKEEALAKAAQKNAQPGDSEFGLMSSHEYEMARAEQKKLEQEREDFLLAQRLAEEEKSHAAKSPAPRPPAVPVKRTDGRWNCAVCTYENEPLHLVCAMCMIPRAAQKQ